MLESEVIERVSEFASLWDIVKATLEGRQPKGMQLEELAGAMPRTWEEQRLLTRL